MTICPKCGKKFEPCYLCRGQYPHQQCINDDMCHDCFMIENPNGRLGITKKPKGVVIMKTNGLTFLEAVKALQDKQCEAIENENHMRFTVSSTGLTTLRGQKEGHKVIGLGTYLDNWCLINPKPKTEFRKLDYWIVVNNDGSITITRTAPTSRKYPAAQHVRTCSFEYVYTFPG